MSDMPAVAIAFCAAQLQRRRRSQRHFYTCLLRKRQRAECHKGRCVWQVQLPASVQQTVRKAVGPPELSKSVLQHQRTQPNVDKVVNISELLQRPLCFGPSRPTVLLGQSNHRMTNTADLPQFFGLSSYRVVNIMELWSGVSVHLQSSRTLIP